jgi:hypothetical protein
MVPNPRVVVAGGLCHEVNIEELEAQGVDPRNETLEPRLIGHLTAHGRHAVFGCDVTPGEGGRQGVTGGPFEREFVNQLSHALPFDGRRMASIVGEPR